MTNIGLMIKNSTVISMHQINEAVLLRASNN